MTPEEPKMPLPRVPSADNITPPVFGQQQPAGKKPGAKTPTATFLGSGSVPTAMNAPQKTLLGT